MNATGSRPRARPETPGGAPPGPPDLAPAAPKPHPFLRLRRALRRFVSPARCRALLRLAATVFAEGKRRRAETRLTVAVDINSYFESLSGIGWYLHQLLVELANRDDLRLRLYAHRLVETGDGLRTTVPLPEGPAIEWVRCPISEDTNLPAGLLAKFVARLSPWLMAFDRNDVLFAPNFVPPALFRRARAPLVATIHDLTLWRFPEAMRPDTRLALERRLKPTLRRARLLITDSAAVCGELSEHGIDRRRIRTVRLGPGLVSSRPSSEPSGIAGRYGLFVSTIEPRKNLPTLLAAWRSLSRREAGAPRLVLCGRMGWADDDTRRAIDLAMAEGWAQHVEGTSLPRLQALYRDATVVALPSLYEGFGLPAAEALAAGAPLVCSDLPVLREIAGESAVYVEPRDVGAWERALGALLADDARRADLARRGPAQVADLSWAKTAAATAAVWFEAGA